MEISVKRSALLASTTAIWMVAGVPLATAHGPAVMPGAAAETASPELTQQWLTRAGVTTISFDRDATAAAGLQVGESNYNTVHLPDAVAWQAGIRGDSTLTFSVTGESLGKIMGGRIHHVGDLTFSTPNGEFVLGDLTIAPVGGDGAFSALWRAESPGIDGGLVLLRVKAGFDSLSQTLTIRCPEVRVSPGLAAALGDPALADMVLGTATVRASTMWVGGAEPDLGSGPDMAAANPAAPSGCDMTWCELYGLYMPSGARLHDIVGLSVATTAWNIGDADCIWWPIPNEEHPFIVWNVYRLKDDRFEHIGMSDIKYGFYALANQQCGPPPTCHFEPGHGAGNWLGQGCTDTYSASLNAIQSGCGPRYEVNPWTGYWLYAGSHHQAGAPHTDGIQHRCQVHDADLDPALNPDAEYFCESFYCMLDDVYVYNSAAWKPITVVPVDPDRYNFGMTSSAVYPNLGFAMDAWTGATFSEIAEETPVVEFESPDGRAVLGAKATDLGGGTWHYEYALHNIDMDRQIGSFSIPLAPGTVVTNVGFHAVEHHDEPFNTKDADAVPIDNAPWTPVVTPDAVTWSTTTNPIRWNMLYNFRFDASEPPAGHPAATVGLFRQRDGGPDELEVGSVGPDLACIADIDNSGDVGVTDFLELLAAWGPQPLGHPADIDHDGSVGVTDFLKLLSRWGPCP
jgi:hypothetical protein